MRNKVHFYGFEYHINFKKIKEYQKIPIEKRFMWLYQGNILRMKYPKSIIRLHNYFRKVDKRLNKIS